MERTSREIKLSRARDLSDMNKWKKPIGSPRETSRAHACNRVCVPREKRWNFTKKLFVHDSAGNGNARSPVRAKKRRVKEICGRIFLQKRMKGNNKYIIIDTLVYVITMIIIMFLEVSRILLDVIFHIYILIFVIFLLLYI